MVERRWVLPEGVAAPATARRLIAAARRDDWFPAARVDDCALMATELVTNALVHGEGRISLAIGRLRSGSVRVEVRDGGDGTPMLPASDWSPRSSDHERESGRGLRIVEALALRWGIDRIGPVTCAWFEVGEDETQPHGRSGT